jgi:hypothetical protein
MLRRVLAFFGLALRRDVDELIALAEINVAAGRIILSIVESQRQQIALMSATSDTPKQ